MRNWKKTALLLLAFSLAGCTASEPEPAPEPASESEPQETSPEKPEAEEKQRVEYNAEELVKTGTDQEIDFENDQYRTELYYVVPQIQVESKSVKDWNVKVQDLAVTSIKKAQQKKEPELTGMDYAWFANDDYVSVLVRKKKGLEKPTYSFEGATFSLETGSKVKAEELIDIYSGSEETFEKALKDNIARYRQSLNMAATLPERVARSIREKKYLPYIGPEGRLSVLLSENPLDTSGDTSIFSISMANGDRDPDCFPDHNDIKLEPLEKEEDKKKNGNKTSGNRTETSTDSSTDETLSDPSLEQPLPFTDEQLHSIAFDLDVPEAAISQIQQQDPVWKPDMEAWIIHVEFYDASGNKIAEADCDVDRVQAVQNIVFYEGDTPVGSDDES